MTPTEFNDRIIQPNLPILQALGIPWSREAHVMCLSICGIETHWSARFQMADGPARWFSQFEHGGGWWTVTNHPQCRPALSRVLKYLNIEPSEAWECLPGNDLLGLAATRLNLLPDPERFEPLSVDKGLRIYLRVWKPGKPRPNDWPPAFEAAMGVVG